MELLLGVGEVKGEGRYWRSPGGVSREFMGAFGFHRSEPRRRASEGTDFPGGAQERLAVRSGRATPLPTGCSVWSTYRWDAHLLELTWWSNWGLLTRLWCFPGWGAASVRALFLACLEARATGPGTVPAPESEDRERRQEVPTVFRTKGQLAHLMLERAVDSGASAG